MQSAAVPAEWEQGDVAHTVGDATMHGDGT